MILIEALIGKNACDFLHGAASATEQQQQSGSQDVTLNLSVRPFDHLLNSTRTPVSSGITTSRVIAAKVLKKLEQYDLVVRSTITSLACLLDPRFRIDSLGDGDILRLHVTLDDMGNDEDRFRPAAGCTKECVPNG